MDLKEFRKRPLLGIVRGVAENAIAPLVETAAAEGLRALEITVNTEGAPALIAKAREAADGRLSVGAGTVLTMGDLRTVIDAGATFIVTPVLVADVVSWCREHGVPVFPGALTPTEVWAAWRAGATMVKLFPASVFGPGYIAELKGPFDGVEILACGGVTPENVAGFMRAGATAAAFGGSVFKREWLDSGRFDLIGAKLRSFIDTIS
jgi:2-dehydro-3-deoxyphosphogluconate aldolase/(4S)-4-hydroxy-2-oxoglutarate aldolase